VVSLMQQAESERSAGRYEQASANLERALRIEPRNYFLWSALASIYLQQGLPDQAESVALKSSSLARGNTYVELENWKVIASSRQARGDAIGALQAQAKVDELQRQTGG
jgi:predicted Zn-dependent protease